MRGRPLVSVRCPDCRVILRKVKKSWVCPNEGCSLIRLRRFARGRVERIQREARPRSRPLSVEELRDLMEPYLTPSVERLLNEATAPSESIPA